MRLRLRVNCCGYCADAYYVYDFAVDVDACVHSTGCCGWYTVAGSYSISSAAYVCECTTVCVSVGAFRADCYGWSATAVDCCSVYVGYSTFTRGWYTYCVHINNTRGVIIFVHD